MDYESLRVIWWGLLGVLLIGFMVTDGFDLGVAALLRVLAKTEDERVVLLETIEPVWEGNQVWFILGGGATFAAFPALYAAGFFGFYFGMFLILVALILRPVGFNFRGKIDDPRWRGVWDWILIAGGILPAFLFGVVFANLFRGVPLTIDPMMRLGWQGGFFDLLTPYTIFVGLLSLVMVLLHGCVWSTTKADELIAARAKRLGQILAYAFVVMLGVAGVWTLAGLDAYRIVTPVDALAPSAPLLKEVEVGGSWIANYQAHPWMWLAPAAAFAGAIGVVLLLRRLRYELAFAASSLAIVGTLAAAGLCLFPFLMPSSAQPNASLTLWDASSSELTLEVMLVAALFFLPLILLYTRFVYRVMGGRVTLEHVRAEKHHY